MNGNRLVLVILFAACRGTETVAPQLGSLRVAVAADGIDVDRDGVLVSVDTATVAIPANGVYEFTGLVVGTHTVRLGGLSTNCTSSESLERTVRVNENATAQVGFALTCLKMPLAATGLIVFASGGAGVPYDLWIMNGDGTGETMLTQSVTVDDFQPSWTPDGQYIVFVSGGAIARIDRTGGGFITLGPAVPRNTYSPSVSPDGRHIAFARDTTRSGAYDIWVMDSGGTNPQSLTSDSAFEDHPSWSPDGSRIAFERASALYVMNADGTNERRLSPADSLEYHWPAWSPDGSKVVFSRRSTGPAHIYTILPDGTGMVPLTTGLDIDVNPAWSADGSRITFASTRGGTFAIWSMRSDGTDMRRLSTIWSASQPAWSP